MSIENATKFLLEAQKDEAKYAQLGNLSGEKVIELASNMGLPCTLEDVKEVLRVAKESMQGLSEKELEQVAGGVGVPSRMTGPINSFQLSCACKDGSHYPTSWDATTRGTAIPDSASAGTVVGGGSVGSVKKQP